VSGNIQSTNADRALTGVYSHCELRVSNDHVTSDCNKNIVTHETLLDNVHRNKKQRAMLVKLMHLYVPYTAIIHHI
jgi:hypothetical protein